MLWLGARQCTNIGSSAVCIFPIFRLTLENETFEFRMELVFGLRNFCVKELLTVGTVTIRIPSANIFVPT